MSSSIAYRMAIQAYDNRHSESRDFSPPRATVFPSRLIPRLVAAFDGDPDKVTIWGESAGAISVFDHMVLKDGDHTYKGKPLFRAGIMNSGSVIPAAPADSPRGQRFYDAVVKAGDCQSSLTTLECLRALPFQEYLHVVNSVPGIFSTSSPALSYLPRPDGTLLTESPEILLQAGKYARVLYIIGSQEDEGTLFALFQSKIWTKT